MKIEAIIWDWNGTLLDDLELVVQINNTMLKNRNLPPVSNEFYLRHFDFPVRDYYQLTGFDLKQEAFEEIAEEYMNRYMEKVLECPLQQGAINCLQLFQKRKIKQYILSAKAEKLLLQTVSHYEIEHFFEKIYGLSSVTAEGKITRGQKLIEENNLNTERTLFIGDTTHDYHVATTYGMIPYLQAGGHHSLERLQKVSENVFRNLGQIYKALLETNFF